MLEHPTDLLKRPYPYSADSERSLLSCCLQNPPYLDEFGDSEELMFVPAHQVMLAAMRQHDRATLDVMSLVMELRDRGKLTKVGGTGAVMALLDYSPSFREDIFRDWLRRCRSDHARRSLIEASIRNIMVAHDLKAPIDHVLSQSEAEVLTLSQSHQQADGVDTETTAVRAAEKALNHIERIKTGQVVPGINTGIKWLDGLTSGLKPAEYCVIAARPSVGKTALMQTMAQHMAENGLPVGIFSIEMADLALGQRMIASTARMDSSRLFSPDPMTDGEMHSILTGVSTIRESAYTAIDTRIHLTPDQMRSKARQWYRTHGIRCLFVDYLQRIAPGTPEARRDQIIRVSQASAACKEMAKELDIPVVALAQLNREGTRKPGSHHLKSCGDIEQDADLIALLSRHDNQPEASSGETYVHFNLEKDRNGPIGETVLRLINPEVRFEAESVSEFDLSEASEVDEDLPI